MGNDEIVVMVVIIIVMVVVIKKKKLHGKGYYTNRGRNEKLSSFLDAAYSQGGEIQWAG